MILSAKSNSPLFEYKVKQFADFIKAERAEIEEIKHYLYYKDVPKGQILYQQGEPSDKLFMLLHGYLMLESTNAGGNEMDVFTHRSQILPLSSLFVQGEYRQTAVAMHETQVLYFQKEALEYLANKYHHIMIHLFKEMSRVMESEDNRMILYASRSIEEKVIQLLLYLGKEIGHEHDLYYRVRNVINVTQLSRMACISRESMSNQINKLKRAELLNIDGDHLVIMKEMIERL